MKLILNIFIFLYIFVSINREFIPIIDLRYIVFILMFILLLIRLFKTKFKLKLYRKNIFIWYFVFVILVFISNFQWFFTELPLNKEVFKSLLIIYLFNFMAVFLFFIYYKLLSPKMVYLSIIIAGLFLFASQLVLYFGYDLPLLGENANVLFDSGDNKLSFFGERIGGYAEDANYATLSMIIFLFSVLMYIKKISIKLLLLTIAIVSILLSFSKTIILGLFLFLFLRITNKNIIFTLAGLLILILLSPLLYETIKYGEKLSTMATRLIMWTTVLQSFPDNPFLGIGISGVRSYFENAGWWYVQPHNTYIVILIDNGIFALMLLFSYLFYLFKKINNIFYLALLFDFMLIMMTSDMFFLNYWVIILFLLPMIMKRNTMERNNEKIIYNKLIK